MTTEVTVEAHRSETDLFLYLARELDIEYEGAKRVYEQEAIVIGADTST